MSNKKQQRKEVLQPVRDLEHEIPNWTARGATSVLDEKEQNKRSDRPVTQTQVKKAEWMCNPTVRKQKRQNNFARCR